ncbi:diadenylate cyclase CdaA [Hydrogenibacillus sp. N12]|nr:diadenylate cyclase CdaA [Hydrogenibacillus sp. N12]
MQSCRKFDPRRRAGRSPDGALGGRDGRRNLGAPAWRRAAGATGRAEETGVSIGWLKDLWFGYVKDAVDIVLVAAVIYYLILLVRGTRAMQLVKGLVVIVGIWLVSSVLGLSTLRWLVSQAFSLGVVAVLVLFQPELRRALEHLGSGQMFRRRGFRREGAVGEETVEAILQAADYLSKRRIGALIAVERDVGLKEYIETGVPLGATVTKELLIQLFIPNTPLHDGAAIIVGDAVAAASCYLPLTENPAIHQSLGTRHRAAIGLSEATDAVVVVVSEETGDVSVAVGGHLARGLGAEALRALLMETFELGDDKRAERRFASWGWRKRDG